MVAYKDSGSCSNSCTDYGTNACISCSFSNKTAKDCTAATTNNATFGRIVHT